MRIIAIPMVPEKDTATLVVWGKEKEIVAEGDVGMDHSESIKDLIDLTTKEFPEWTALSFLVNIVREK